jgi:excisionase family DNA binding protein
MGISPNRTNQEKQQDSLLTIQQLGAYLNIPVRTLYQMAAQGTLPGTKIGKHWRFSREAIDRWLYRKSSVQTSVLVIDDDPLIGQLFEDVFAEDGHVVFRAEEAQTAIRWITERAMTVVFLDVVIPGVDGARVLEQIRQIRPTQPVILMTAYPDSDVVIRALAQGPITLIQKPFSIQHLRATVKTLMED